MTIEHLSFPLGHLPKKKSDSRITFEGREIRGKITTRRELLERRGSRVRRVITLNPKQDPAGEFDGMDTQREYIYSPFAEWCFSIIS